jgi:membrane-associated protease RseP (regulator of RpoE activity)
MQLGSSLLLKLLDRCFAPPVPDGSDLLLSPVAFAAWGGMFVTMINLLPVSQLDGGHVAYALFGPRQNRIAMWVHRSMLVLFGVAVASSTFRDLRAGLRLWHLGLHVQDSLFWLVWFEVLAILGTVTTSRARLVLGPSEPRLGVGTRAFAIANLVLLAGLFHESSSPLLWTAWFGGLAVLITMEAKWGVLRSTSAVLDHPPTGSTPLSWGRCAVAVVTLLFFVLLFMPTPISM